MAAETQGTQWKPVIGEREHAQSWLFKAEHADARGQGETAESCALIALAHAVLAVESSIQGFG
jgi:hypothetical protein